MMNGPYMKKTTKIFANQKFLILLDWDIDNDIN